MREGAAHGALQARDALRAVTRYIAVSVGVGLCGSKNSIVVWFRFGDAKLFWWSKDCSVFER